jgi:hypothetical protein
VRYLAGSELLVILVQLRNDEALEYVQIHESINGGPYEVKKLFVCMEILYLRNTPGRTMPWSFFRLEETCVPEK